MFWLRVLKENTFLSICLIQSAGCQGYSQSTADEKVSLNELNHVTSILNTIRGFKVKTTAVVKMHKDFGMACGRMSLLVCSYDR